jgi:hypothetical protein
MDKALVCMFIVLWFLSPLERAVIPRWSLCWGPIIIGDLILQLSIWHCSHDEDIWLAGLG